MNYYYYFNACKYTYTYTAFAIIVIMSQWSSPIVSNVVRIISVLENMLPHQVSNFQYLMHKWFKNNWTKPFLVQVLNIEQDHYIEMASRTRNRIFLKTIMVNTIWYT